ncbi:RBBP9/YdeN family alpha/beta hydrolase [Novispirillum itersonii]|uniref:RBBP9/YdeN family alpha/beta hydrolase n=1 Tax=Novispirillum itersonii TaxID=189 RepID=UPI000364C836|nr:alpha/beta hydrolase [Novispirillum itersonii]
MTTYLVVPGWQNSGPQHWQSLWQQKSRNWYRVEQADWENPVGDQWVATLDQTIRSLGQSRGNPILLVAHSLGCLTVAHWFERHSPDGVIGAMLVAPPDLTQPNAPKEIVGFLPPPASPIPVPSVLVGSTNDPYCSVDVAQDFARTWGSTFINAGAVGHINTDSGLGEWPQGQRLLADLVEQAQEEDPSITPRQERTTEPA